MSLKLDDTSLREKFYELSRKLHPDRFVNAVLPEPTYSLRWTTALNRAYQTLRDPVQRTYYLLEHLEVLPNKASQVPLELAEAYFELQDLLTEEKGIEKMKLFKSRLCNELHLLEAKWAEMATDWETSSDRKVILGNLQAYLNKRRYLSSMISDLEKKIGSGDHGDRWH